MKLRDYATTRLEVEVSADKVTLIRSDLWREPNRMSFSLEEWARIVAKVPQLEQSLRTVKGATE
jgi:hypothetical protein